MFSLRNARSRAAGGSTSAAFTGRVVNRNRAKENAPDCRGVQRRDRRGYGSQNRNPDRRLLAFEEAPQLLGPRRMAELAQRLRLDLADALARDVELLADLLERVVGVHL